MVEKIHCKHPFKDGKASHMHGWFDSFKSRHPQSSFCSPQFLSYSRVVFANENAIADFFKTRFHLHMANLRNLITKPMQCKYLM